MAIFGGWRSVWLIVMFDLPTDTAAARADYRRFREFLMDDGFHRLQFSVYARHCASDENSDFHKQRVLVSLPPDGEVRLLSLTDKQFGRMEVRFGRIHRISESPPEQVMLL